MDVDNGGVVYAIGAVIRALAGAHFGFHEGGFAGLMGVAIAGAIGGMVTAPILDAALATALFVAGIGAFIWLANHFFK